MATRYWKSTSSTALATTTNWTGSGALTNDDLIIDYSGSAAAVAAGVPSNVVNTIVSGSLACNSLTVVDTASKPLTITGSSAITIGSSGGSYTNQQFITTANTVWNHTGTITLAAGSTFNISTAGAVIQAPITLTSINIGAVYKTIGVFKTSKTFILNTGILDISTNDLYCGIFSSSNTNIRSIVFGNAGKGIYLDNTASATVFVISSAINFSYTGTSRIVVTNSGSATTKTINTTGLNSSSLALNFYFSDSNKTNSNVIAVSSNSYFLNFDATNWNTAGTFTNSARTIFGDLNLCANTTWTGTTSTYITNFDRINRTQIIDYNNASGVGPISINNTNSNTTYPVNFVSRVTSTGALLLGSASPLSNFPQININATVNVAAITHYYTDLNINTNGRLTGTTYTHYSGAINFNIKDYYALTITGAYTSYSNYSSSINFQDNSFVTLSCGTFVVLGTLLSLTGKITSFAYPSNLPCQIEISDRATSAVAISYAPIITSGSDIGFSFTYSGGSSLGITDTTGTLNYTFGLSAPITIVSANNFKGLDLVYQSGQVALASANQINVNGSFYDSSSTLYKTTTIGATNSSGTLALKGTRNITNPYVFDMQSSTSLYIVFTGTYTMYGSETANFTTKNTVTLNSGYLDLSSGVFTASTFTAEADTSIQHDNYTSITLTAVTGNVFYVDSTVSLTGDNDGINGLVTLDASGTVTNNTRQITTPLNSLIKDSFSVNFTTTNPQDRVTFIGLYFNIALTNYSGIADLYGAYFNQYETILSPGYLSAKYLNLYTDTSVSAGVDLAYISLSNLAADVLNFANTTINITGNNDASIYGMTSQPTGLILNIYNNIYFYTTITKYKVLNIRDTVWFNSSTYNVVDFTIESSGTFRCSSTAIIDYGSELNVTFQGLGWFYGGNNNYYNKIITNNEINLYDTFALDTLLLRNNAAINGNNTTINNIIIDHTYNLTSFIITFGNTTTPFNFNFSSITELNNNNDSALVFTVTNDIPVTINFDKTLLIGPNSNNITESNYIKKVSSGYSIRRFTTVGYFDSALDETVYPRFTFNYTGTANYNKFFLMF
jgi:hypothetical protein